VPREIKGHGYFSLTTPPGGYTMNAMACAKHLLAALGVAVLLSCASAPVPPAPVEPPPDAVASVTGSDDGGAAPAVAGGGEPAAQFVVTEEVYQKTFEEIEGVIAELNAIIRARDFARWERRLTAAYRERTSSPAYLAEVSQSAALKKNGVTLRSLEDYFTQVVVPSRSSVKLDQLAFVDATHVKAITIIQGEAYILYWLVREDGTWDIGIW
jgi:hypothetical protein